MKLYTFIIQIANTILNQCISICLYKIQHITKAIIGLKSLTNFYFFFFFFSVRCRLVIVVVSSGRWNAPSGVGRWLFHGVCFLGNFLLARWFLFFFCGEAMTAGHGLWFVIPVRKGKGLIFQCQFFSCGYAVCSGLFLAGISWSVRGVIVSEGCFVGDYSLHLCA